MDGREHTEYPAHWEADVLLADGRAARVRPVHTDDVALLLAFYDRISAESKYMRFLASRPQLTDRDVQRFTEVDHRLHVSFVMTLGADMIGLGSYDLLDAGEAEVAFLVEDAHHGRGVGTMLLEHLAQAGRERGVTHFVAEVLPENGRMISAFRAAGYRVAVGFIEGLMRFEFPIAPTETSTSVMWSREHRSEARSMERFFVARSVAVVGASRRPRTMGWRLVHNLVTSGYTGRVYVVNPVADAILGLPVYRSVRDVPDPVDLAIIAVPASAVHDVVLDCAAKGVFGLVVVSGGFADAGPAGRARQRDLLDTARGHGMRLVGPSALGVINTHPAHSLNATVAPLVPHPGRIGFFAQSGALGMAILRDVAERGLGLSTFVSAGNRADVSGNDLLQYWEDDARTEVVLLYLESIGNPRKFFRIARRLGRAKPVVAVKSGRATQGVPLGHAVRASPAPPAAVDAMFRQAGIIQVETLDDMFDCAQILAHQPLPAGPRVGIISNSEALMLLMLDACLAQELTVDSSKRLPPAATGAVFEAALVEMMARDSVHAVIAVYGPPLDAGEDDVAEAIAGVGRASAKPLLTVFLGMQGVPQQLRVTDEHGSAARGSVPSYQAPDRAARALAGAVWYSGWRARLPSAVPVLDGIDAAAAQTFVGDLLGAHPQGVDLDEGQVRRLAAAYGLEVAPTRRVDTLDEALAAGAELGWDVVLKATSPQLRRHPYLDHVRVGIGGQEEMRGAWHSLASVVADRNPGFVVQAGGPPGLPVTIRSVEDPSFGPMVSVGLSGPASDLLGDLAYRICPLTLVDAADMVRGIKAAPLFFAYGGSEGLDVAALEAVIHRIGRLKDTLPEVVNFDASLLVGPRGALILWAAARVLAPTLVRADHTRRLAGPPP